MGLCAVVLSSCATHQELAQRKLGLNNMPGLSAEKVYDIYGVPDKVEQLPDRSVVDSWSHVYSYVEPDDPSHVPLPKRKTILGKAGNSMIKNMLGMHDPGDVVEEECILNITIQNNVVVLARTDHKREDACKPFYDKWYAYQNKQMPLK